MHANAARLWAIWRRAMGERYDTSSLPGTALGPEAGTGIEAVAASPATMDSNTITTTVTATAAAGENRVLGIFGSVGG